VVRPHRHVGVTQLVSILGFFREEQAWFSAKEAAANLLGVTPQDDLTIIKITAPLRTTRGAIFADPSGRAYKVPEARLVQRNNGRGHLG